MIFIVALGVIVILVGMVLVFAQNMRTEAEGSANRLSSVQADAIELGAEQWVLSQAEAYGSDAYSLTQVAAESLRVGNGYFWLLSPDAESDQYYSFGIDDESAKINLNVATSDTNSPTALTLLNLPNMTNDVADSIVAWRSPVGSTGTAATNGAQSEYYESLSQPYDAKNAPFETVEELLLVRDLTKDMLFGYDLNRNGVLDALEQQASGGAAAVNSGSSDSRGFYNYVTTYSVEPNTDVDGTARVNVNDGADAVQKVLDAALPAGTVSQVMARLTPVYNPRGGTNTSRTGTLSLSGSGGGTLTLTGTANPTVFANIGLFYTASGMKPAEFALVADRLTTTAAKTIKGLVNVSTAPKQVLMCLPGIEDSDADALISARSNGADTSNIAWVFDALPTPPKAADIAGKITSRSFQYSADIVAVSGDGRGFKRVRIVVDASKVPAKIVYRRDLTGYGWPLDPGIKADLRAGRYSPNANGSNGSNGGGGMLGIK